MIKSILLLSCLTFLMTSLSAQSPKDNRYQTYAGRYGKSSGIALFKDGSYLLYGYATMVFGKYTFEENRLLFKADHTDQFEVFAHRNPYLVDTVRINFVGFERGLRTFAKLGSDEVIPVFNKDANCFDGPFVYHKNGQMDQFELAVEKLSFNSDTSASIAYNYLNTAGFNDFVFVHNKADRAYEDFVGLMAKSGKSDVIKLSNYGGDEGFLKQDHDEKAWEEVLAMKDDYDQQMNNNMDTIYANRHYRIFPAPDNQRYVFDEKIAAYVYRDTAKSADYYGQNPYNDPTMLRRYQRLKPKSIGDFEYQDFNSEKSLFYTVCGDNSGRSYRYNGIVDTIPPDQELQRPLPSPQLNKPDVQ